MKRSTLLIFLFLIGLGTTVYYYGFSDLKDRLEPLDLVSSDAIYFLETNDPIDTWKTISKHQIWQHLSTQAYFRELTKDTDKLTDIIDKNEFLFKLLGDRKLSISSHFYNSKQYDFLFVLDIGAISKLEITKNYLGLFLSDDYEIINRKFEQEDILEIRNKQTQETTYLSFIKNLLAVSFKKNIIESALQEITNPSLTKDEDFIQINQNTKSNVLFNFYFNYTYLSDFLSLYLTPKDINNLKGLDEQIAFSGLGFNFKDDNLLLSKGYTNIHDSIFSYLKLFKKVGKGKIKAPSVIPKSTSFYLSMAFDNYKDFFKALEKDLQKNAKKYKTYNKNKTRIEGFLDISIEEHFIDWIGEEIAFIQLPPSKELAKNQYALILKAKSRRLAEEKLGYIGKQVRKRTPLAFKGINYKGYQIQFLAIKGFFKLFLGKLFNKFDKPYLTYINDYVIFSNHPYTIKQIIDQYDAKQTLKNSQNFRSFFKRFKPKSQLFLYTHTPNLYNSLGKWTSPPTWQNIQKNKDYILCFQNIGFQMVHDNDLFKTNFSIQYQDINAVKNLTQIDQSDLRQASQVNPNQLMPLDSFYISQKALSQDEVVDIENILPEDFTAKRQQTFYDNGQVKEEVRLKDALKNGSYFEYYPDASLKTKGRYKNNQRVGLWKSYSKEGKIIGKTRY